MSDNRVGIWNAYNNILDYGIAFCVIIFILSVFFMLCRLAWWVVKFLFVALIFIGKRLPAVLKFCVDVLEVIYLYFMAALEIVYRKLKALRENSNG